MEFINSKLATSERRRREAHNPSRICSYCKKREPPNARSEQTLKRCSRCRVSLYCSRACQRADWKRGHQRTCISGAIMGRKSCYLDGLQSEEMAMDQLLDAYRLRVEDEKMYCGRLRGRYTTMNSADTCTDIEGSENSNSQARQAAFQDFQAFLDLAESESHNNNEGHRGHDDAASPSSSATIDTDTDNSSSSSPPPSASSPPTTNIITTNIIATKEKGTAILPRWWNAEKRALCEARALDESGEIWSSLRHPAGKAEILDHYRDNLMPMKLRMLAERVYGSDVMDQSRS